MNCRKNRNRISSYLDGRLCERDRAEVEEHLSRCSACSSDAASLSEALASLAALERAEQRAGGWDRLRDRIAATPSRSRVPAPVSWRSAAAAAFTLLIVVFGSWLLLRTAPEQHVAKKSPTAPVTAPRESAPSAQPDAPEPEMQPTVTEGASKIAVVPSRGWQPKKPAPVGERRKSRPSAPVIADKPPVPAPESEGPSALPIVATAEPDPESGEGQAAEVTETMAREVADMVVQGLQPLVLAADEGTDPAEWLYDIEPEEWL